MIKTVELLLLDYIPLDSGVGSCTSFPIWASVTWGPEKGEVRLACHMSLLLCRISEREEDIREHCLHMCICIFTYYKPCEGMA